MPATVAVPLITSAIGAGTSLYAQKKQNDAAKAQAAAQASQAEYNVPGLEAPDDGGSPATMPGGMPSGVYGGVPGEQRVTSQGGSSSNSVSTGRAASQSQSSGGTVIDPEIRNAAFGGATNFLETGGFSPGDLDNIRSRAVSPVRATYSNANREVSRQRALQGGYSPNYTAAMTRMAREQGAAAADAGTNAEASIAQMVQQGKLGGLNALGSMYANMPTFNQSTASSYSNDDSYSNSGSSSVSYDYGPEGYISPQEAGEMGAANLPPVQQPQQSTGSKIGNTLLGIGKVALPIALSAWENSQKKPPIPKLPQVTTGIGNTVPGTATKLPGLPKY